MYDYWFCNKTKLQLIIVIKTTLLEMHVVLLFKGSTHVNMLMFIE